MRPALRVVCVVVLACLGMGQPRVSAAEELNRSVLRSDVGFELLGKAAAYSFYYQYTIIPAIAVEAGFGAIGGGVSDDNATIAFFPFGGKLYLVPKDGTIFLAGGGVVVTAGTDSGPFDDSASYGYVGPGFEYRSLGGLLFRGTAYALMSGDGFFIWPGLTIGYAF